MREQIFKMFEDINDTINLKILTRIDVIKNIAEVQCSDEENDIIQGLNSTEEFLTNAKLTNCINKLSDFILFELNGVSSLKWINDISDLFKIDIAYNIGKNIEKYTVDDFYLSNDMEKVFYPKKVKRSHDRIFPYETDEYKIYKVGDREYEVYRNGRVFSKAFDRADSVGTRIKHFSRKQIETTQDEHGYWYMNMGGRKYKKRILVHRLVAEAWLGDRSNEGLEVNHIDGNKGNNSLENLEWVTRSENELHKHRNDLDGITLETRYIAYKNSMKYSPLDNEKVKALRKEGLTYKELIEITNRSLSGLQNVIYGDSFTSEEHKLFEKCYCWEYTLIYLNSILNEYNKNGYDLVSLINYIPNNMKFKYIINLNYNQLIPIIKYAANSDDDRWKQIYIDLIKLPYLKMIKDGDII